VCGEAVRILAASDVHGNHDTYRWLGDRAVRDSVDAVVLAGDLFGVPDGFASVEEAQRADAREVLRLLARIPSHVAVLYVMGNDDWIDLESESRQVRPLHMKRADHGGFNFVGYQYTLPFMGGVFERTESEIGRDLLALDKVVDDRTVLVTHGPAAGVMDLTGLGSAGSTSLHEFLLRHTVRAHVHGHIHGCFGRVGSQFNVAAGRLKRAMVIDLDTMAHEVLLDDSTA
jgi:Icc-related predicted phosphoesterase